MAVVALPVRFKNLFLSRRNGMSQYYFEKLTNEEKYNTRLRIATRKYSVFDEYVIVSINLGEAKDVYITKENKSELCDEFSVYESIYKEIGKQLGEASDDDFIEVFKQYKLNGGQLGVQIKDKLFIKFYLLEKPTDIERDDVGRKWIDYNAQLSRSNHIYDTENGCGIWVTNLSFLYDAMRAVDRYGINIMVLSPIDDLRYIIMENEIVGDGYEVKMHGSLNDETTWYTLWKLAGDKIIEYMPMEIRDRFVGARKIYDKYIADKEMMLMAVPEKNNVRNPIIDMVQSIINKVKNMISGNSDQ